jgi:hypothetical protein
MEAVPVKCWEDLEEKLRVLRAQHTSVRNLLFRGQSDSSWPLRTTLERRVDQNTQIDEYYRIISAIQPQVETFTDQKWDIQDHRSFIDLVQEYDKLSLELSFGRLPAYSYLIYLRHHGFPSPLLDWTASAYVAAYFAFQPSSSADRAIYAYSEFGEGGKSRSSRHPEIYSFGPYVRGHKRHFLQQSEYTICIQFHQDIPTGQKEWRFAQHDDVFSRNTGGQDVLTKFIIPAKERVKILKILNEYNLNALSLFGSEESLLETLALRQFDFKIPAETN